jgi:RNA polymerase-interacting CarD/CdnL/TRCF family regulator
MSEDKDKIIVSLLQRIQVLEQELNNKKIENENLEKEHKEKVVALSSLVDKIKNKEHELSSEEKQLLDQAANLIIAYGKAINI